MESLTITPTEFTPQVQFDISSHIFEISSLSLLFNAFLLKAYSYKSNLTLLCLWNELNIGFFRLAGWGVLSRKEQEITPLRERGAHFYSRVADGSQIKVAKTTSWEAVYGEIFNF